MSLSSADEQEQLRRLRWQCRRGMLELDHLLSRFLELGYADLSASDRVLFVALLREQDQDLHKWLISRAELPELKYQALVEHVRAVAAEPSA